MAQFPINLNLAGKRVLVVGGRRIAFRKTEQLVECGADVTVVAPDIIDELASLNVTCVRRKFELSDLESVWFVITATGDNAVDQLIFDEATRRRIWVNSADDPERCSFTLPAVLRRGDLMITSSTAGSSPALSSFIRNFLSHAFVDDWCLIVDELAQHRREIHARGESTEDVDWAPIIASVLDKHPDAVQALGLKSEVTQ
jgi:precorrin-2 dehydrogenase/sirohydrochlorin ferrochelatase